MWACVDSLESMQNDAIGFPWSASGKSSKCVESECKRFRRTMKVTNVTFHGIGTPSTDVCAEERDVWLREAQFRAILDVMQGRMDVCITVDDGNVSDLEIVAPALKERNMRASFFVPVGLLGQSGYMSKSDVRQLTEAGFVTGSHGMEHVDWRKLGDDDLRCEVHDSRQILEQMLGRSVLGASCPFGSYDRRVLRFLKEGGYRRVYTSDRGGASQQAWLQTRNTIYAWDDPVAVERMLSKDPLSSDFIMCRIKTAIKRLR